MRNENFDEFCELLDAVCSLLSRGTYRASAVNSAMWFRSLQSYPIDVVRSAFDAHVKDPQRGRFVPVPADLIAQINGLSKGDGRPGVEEAWAMSLAARDEAETVVWTAEMSQAWAVARNVMALGDEVGARMAFRESYARLVDDARHLRIPVAWMASLGFDPDRRALAVTAAVALGRMPESELIGLPAPRDMPLLEVATSAAPDHIRQKLRELRESFTAWRGEWPSADAMAKSETAERKSNASELVREYSAEMVRA